MKSTHLKILVLALALANATAASAANLLAPAAGDRIAPVPQANRSATSASLDRSPVAMSWRLAAADTIDSNPATHLAQSREFWVQADAASLQRGLELHLTAPGGVIRISPVLGKSSTPIDPQTLELSRNGVVLERSAISSVLKPEDLAQGSMDFPEGTGAFRLAESAGSGRFTIRAAHASGSYLVHVFDVGSEVVLSAQTERDTWFVGESFRASARLQGLPLARIDGVITGPDGSSQPLRFNASRDGSQLANADLSLPALGASQGLYELHLWAAGGTDAKVLRDVRTAFALAAPTARLTGSYEPLANRSTLGWTFALDVGTASRYQLDAVLMVDGLAYATAQSAAWLEPGTASMELSFDPGLFPQGRPVNFELRDLRLVDQGQLVTLERRARALTSTSGSKQ